MQKHPKVSLHVLLLYGILVKLMFSLQIFRCAIRRSPSSSLTNDCITAMAEGLNSVAYNHFLLLLWGDTDSAYLGKNDVGVQSEWEAFCSTITKLCQESKPTTQNFPDSVSHSSWEFLINSRFHKNYRNLSFVKEICPGKSTDQQGFNSFLSSEDQSQSLEKSSYPELLMETLDTLHAVYETLKLDCLRKR